MIIAFMLCAWIIVYYTKEHRKISQYQAITGTCTECEYYYRRRHRKPGGNYKTTVRYYYNGVHYEQKLQYNTRKKQPGESIDCLVNPDNPTIIYPETALKATKAYIWLGCGAAILFLLSGMKPLIRLLLLS